LCRAKDGRAGGVGIEQGVGREEGFAEFIEVGRGEAGAGFPEETGGGVDGLMLEGVVDALGDVGREFGEALANVVDLLWRWLVVVARKYRRRLGRDASPYRGEGGRSPVIEAEQVVVGIMVDAVHAEEFECVVVKPPGTEIEDTRAEVMGNVCEVVLGSFRAGQVKACATSGGGIFGHRQAEVCTRNSGWSFGCFRLFHGFLVLVYQGG